MLKDIADICQKLQKNSWCSIYYDFVFIHIYIVHKIVFKTIFIPLLYNNLHPRIRTANGRTSCGLMLLEKYMCICEGSFIFLKKIFTKLTMSPGFQGCQLSQWGPLQLLGANLRPCHVLERNYCPNTFPISCKLIHVLNHHFDRKMHADNSHSRRI